MIQKSQVEHVKHMPSAIGQVIHQTDQVKDKVLEFHRLFRLVLTSQLNLTIDSVHNFCSVDNIPLKCLQTFKRKRLSVQF